MSPERPQAEFSLLGHSPSCPPSGLDLAASVYPGSVQILQPSMNPATPRNPVLLVHGIDDTGMIFCTLRPYLEELGWPVHDLDLIPSNGELGLDELAVQVAGYVDRTFTPDQPIDLVGFSMGGIVSRYYVQRLGGLRRVQRLITLASPHQGTWTAYLRPNAGGNQMRPDSLFLRELNQDAYQLEEINFTSIWTPFDLMIIPATSSWMPVGRNCPVWVGGHAWMVSELESLKMVAEALLEPMRRSTNTPVDAVKSRSVNP